MDAMRDYSLGTSLAEKYEILKFYFFLDRNAVTLFICSKKRHMSTRYDKDAQKNVRSWFWGNCNVLLYCECYLNFKKYICSLVCGAIAIELYG